MAIGAWISTHSRGMPTVRRSVLNALGADTSIYKNERDPSAFHMTAVVAGGGRTAVARAVVSALSIPGRMGSGDYLALSLDGLRSPGAR